ncbi:MAG: AAA family ATPase, partial [bacterium]|nr:AAA family ATPase [bacterium]
MYIKKMEINNFRNFSNFSIDFTTGFQTLIGENNIGKSNLYWAIRLLLDKNLSYNTRNLEEQDFHNFQELSIESYISVSIVIYGEDLASIPNLHSLKTSDNTVRISYLYIHKSKLIPSEDIIEKIDIKDFRWQLFGGGEDFNLETYDKLSRINFRDIEGINLF